MMTFCPTGYFLQVAELNNGSISIVGENFPGKTNDDLDSFELGWVIIGIFIF